MIYSLPIFRLYFNSVLGLIFFGVLLELHINGLTTINGFGVAGGETLVLATNVRVNV